MGRSFAVDLVEESVDMALAVEGLIAIPYRERLVQQRESGKMLLLKAVAVLGLYGNRRILHNHKVIKTQ